MTKDQIKITIEATKAAIAERIGTRAKYSPELKRAILVAADAVGPVQFSKESGLAQCLISQWKRTLRNGSNDQSRNITDSLLEVSNQRNRVDLVRTQRNRSGIESKESTTEFVDQIVQAVRQLRASNTGKPRFPAELKERVLQSLNHISTVEFSKRSGLSRSTLCKWQAQGQADRPGVRELIVTPNSAVLIKETKTQGHAVIRAGDKLAIEVPLDFLTPAWILEVVGRLNSGKGVEHV
jgi:transposase-like protein